MKHFWIWWMPALLGASVLAAETVQLNDARQKFCYALGMSLAQNLGNIGVTLSDQELQLVLQGLKDQAGGQTALTTEQMRDAIRAYQEQAWKDLAAKNKAESEKWLTENAKRQGVVTLPSGLQYEVLREGSGTPPKANDQVTVHYRGTLINGKQFDSSYDRGQPARFAVNRVIKGWTEALQLMKPGAKWKLYIPPELAYGERGMRGAIPPNSALIFEVELLGVHPAQPQATKPAPVTSDIIKVPSKEELEKGAKVEIIKASEVEKYLQQQKQQEKSGGDASGGKPSE